MHSVRTRGTARSGAVDWIAAGLAGLLLISATACAGTGTAPAAAPTAVVSTAGSPAVASPEPSAESTPNQQPAFAAKALDVLATIPVKGRAPKTGYSRDQFGQAWADVDRNGCDTRNDMLRRDLTDLALKPGTGDCVVLSGILNDPYTATLINFLRGNSTSDAVQIDHVVALSDAWQKGAQQLTEAQRLSFANDPLNLLAVDGPANQQKSDGDAATWLPANKSYRCDYVARQISVKSSYGLWVTAAEHDAMARVLGDCPDAAAPGSGEAPPPPIQ
ncbi:HNH endonuclease family protein, partial [Arthrobacter sp. SO3]|uniref:HNH endonuclease family protein n=1 Tax=Arthrobacter sp. SO3 TaxID=1897057 RepID=UPI001CFF975A